MGVQATANVDFSQPPPDNLGASDSLVDFLNNEIGRQIGLELGSEATPIDRVASTRCSIR